MHFTKGLFSKSQTEHTHPHTHIHISRHMIIKLLKTCQKQRLKQPEEKGHIIYRKRQIRTTVDFSSETLQVRSLKRWKKTKQNLLT